MYRFQNYNNHIQERTNRSRRHHQLTRPRDVYGYGHGQENATQSLVELPPEGPPPPYEEFEEYTYSMPPAAIYQQPVESQEPRSSRQRTTADSSRQPYAQEQGWQSNVDLALRPAVEAPVARRMNQGAAMCDRVAAAVNEIVGNYFDQQESRHFEDSPAENTTRGLDPAATGNEAYRLNEGITIKDFKKTWLYGNSRLLPYMPPSKIYLSTWQIICSAARASMDVYRRPRRGERQEYVEADWRQGTKAMFIKSRFVDDKNLIVIAIRGSKWNLIDWAVNFRPAPTEPIGFLDDEGNACHAGFLEVARAMIAPVAARLREIIQQNPSRASSSLVITGHSAGGAVASLLYMHMMSTTIVSDLSDLTGIFKRVHCIVFGTPPLSFLPLQLPAESKNLFMHFVNEGDLVVRADKEYLGTLARIITAPAPVIAASSKPHGIRQQFSRQTLKTGARVVNKVLPPRCDLPEATLSTAGKVILLREAPRDRATEAVQCSDQELRGVVFGDLEMHDMELYWRRVVELATAAVTGKGVG